MKSAVLLSAVTCAFADLPVHCLRHEVVGNWKFTLGKPSSERSGCGHARPDAEESQPSFSVVDDHKAKEELTIELGQPNIAKLNGQKGTWTMIYDEGLEVKVGNRVYMAFSNFSLNKDLTGSGHNTSHCDQTQVGWYSDVDRKEFGCFYGKQVQATGTKKAAPVPKPKAGKAADTKPLDHSTQKNKVDKINKKLSMLQLGWKASVHQRWNGMTMQDLNSFAGLRRTVPVHDQHREINAQRSHSQHKSFLQQKDSRTKSTRNGKLPKEFDWRDVDGTDYTEPVMDQGDCGSCYDASSMRMLTARHKIAINDTTALPWSINFPLHCSEYNQGCKGGFGLLTAKWSGDVGLLPATCMRYNTAGSCKLECDLEKDLKGQKRYRAANHRYINQWYGNFNSSVDAIKEEIYKGGPVVLSFEPAEDFMFYSEGVYRSAPDAAAKGKGKLKQLRKHIDFDQEWERVDHAVVTIGWGEDNGAKYWLIQNSWGPDWGEDGLFRIAMGEDESGIESIPESADVIEDVHNGRHVAELFKELAAKVAKK